jgi:hypothetical protein
LRRGWASDGKLVVPEDVQSAFKLKPGAIIDFYLDETARTAATTSG